MAVQNVGRIQRILHEHEELFSRENFPVGEDNNSFLYQSLIDINQSADYIKKMHSIKSDNVDFPKTKIGKAKHCFPTNPVRNRHRNILPVAKGI